MRCFGGRGRPKQKGRVRRRARPMMHRIQLCEAPNDGVAGGGSQTIVLIPKRAASLRQLAHGQAFLVASTAATPITGGIRSQV